MSEKKKPPSDFRKRLSTRSSGDDGPSDNSEPEPLTAQSTTPCPKCGTHIKTGLGGQHNLDQHMRGKECQKKQKELAKKHQTGPKATFLTKYWSKALEGPETSCTNGLRSRTHSSA
ncbi:hypothetical protein B0H17DRAFT_1154980 [Mycena rosella]|uniref:Uncharacterized protein n=1 Tax=Mycena rosella TaxID=1033263 RepID=A0AAD7F5I3_MYCRO|nr:hypothetical protein B0H17DRAFT_1154980 [Mycena rosella]